MGAIDPNRLDRERGGETSHAPTEQYLLPPWRQRARDLLPRAATRPRSTVEVPPPIRYTEEALWEHSMRVRAAEVEPPDVTHYPVGTWCAEGHILALYQLREYRLDHPALLFPEGWKSNANSAKYANWIAAGSEPPPGSAFEQQGGRVVVTNGHHRATALRAAGREHVWLWVSPLVMRPNQFDSSILTPYGLTHRDAVRAALAAGHGVPAEVLADYPDLQQNADRPRFVAALGSVPSDDLDVNAMDLAPASHERDVGIEV